MSLEDVDLPKKLWLGDARDLLCGPLPSAATPRLLSQGLSHPSLLVSRSRLDSAFRGHHKERSWRFGVRSNPPCASPRERRAVELLSLERFSVGVPRGWGASLLYLPPELEAAKEEGSVSRVPGSKCNGRSPSSSAAAGSILLMAPATARDAASVRTSPEVPEPARLAAAAAAAGHGASGLPAPAFTAARVPSSSPCRWCVRDSAHRWEPPTEVSVPRATGAEERAAAPRSPCTAANQLRLPGCALRSPLKRGWRLPCAHACCEGFPLRLGTPGDTRSPSFSYTKGVAVARKRCE